MAHAERRRRDRYPHDLKLAAKCLDVHGRRLGIMVKRVIAEGDAVRPSHRPRPSLGAMMDRRPNDEVDEDRDHIGDMQKSMAAPIISSLFMATTSTPSTT